MTDDRSCHGQLAKYDRKIMDSDWVHKDYSMECFTKFVFNIDHVKCITMYQVILSCRII